MASDVLSLIVKANLVAAAALIVILALRLPVARRFGARAAYALWLVAPLAVAASLAPARRIVTEVVVGPAGETPPVEAATQAAGLLMGSLTPDIDFAAIGLAVWLLGATAWLATLVRSQLSFRRSLGRLSREGGVFRAEAAGIGPALVGALRPRIVLPADFESQFTPEERAIVLAHERTHLKSGDHLVNALAALVQCAAWFNPLVHLAAVCLRIDQELACDAAVVARHPEQRRRYAEAMLKAQLTPLTAPLACHWPGGAHPLKRRIAMLQNAPSRARRTTGLAMVALIGIGAGAGAWAAQPPQVDVVTRQAYAKPGSRAAWVGERRAEAQKAAQRRQHGLTAGVAEEFDRMLVEAVIAGDDHTAANLLSKGADVNAKLTGDGSPLIVAAREGRIEIATRLIRAGADVNGFVLYDETPLINAARAGHLPMVRFLLDNGADPNLAVPSGNRPGEMRSPLGMAGDPLVADYLKSRGARS